MQRTARLFLRSRRAAAALEFAIIAPLLFASVLGTFELGHAIYEQNHLSAAVAAGARVVTLKGGADETAIKNAVLAKFSSAQQANVTVILTNQTMDSGNFKKIAVTYAYTPIITLGGAFSTVTLSATRYAPII